MNNYINYVSDFVKDNNYMIFQIENLKILFNQGPIW